MSAKPVGRDLISGSLAAGGVHDFGAGSELAPYSYHIWRCK